MIFVLQTQPHDSFGRSGNDLLTTVKITLSEALLGFSRILVTHMDGRGIRVSSPPGKIIRPKDTIILRGEGMPVFKQSGEKGDLFVVLDVEMPTEQWLRSVDAEVYVQSYCLNVPACRTNEVYLRRHWLAFCRQKSQR